MHTPAPRLSIGARTIFNSLLALSVAQAQVFGHEMSRLYLVSPPFSLKEIPSFSSHWSPTQCPEYNDARYRVWPE